MKPSSFLLGVLAPLAVSAVTPCLDEEFDNDVFDIPAHESRRSLLNLVTRDIITVDLWIHLLVSGPTAANGYVDAIGILQQVNYLNTQYSPWNIQFQLKPISYAINAECTSDIDQDKLEKMKELHRGDYKSLNVYLVEGAKSGVCSFPDSSGAPVNQTILDGGGCFVPLGSGISKSSGTVAHEIGHWFGLYHVFQGGCNGTDYCDDTAAQNKPSYGKLSTPGNLTSCPAPDSCPSLPGRDNVNNFMDYTDCSHEFTPCQSGRMIATYNKYRANRDIADGVH